MTSRLFFFFAVSRQTHPIMAKRIWLLNISIEKKITQINFVPPPKIDQPLFSHSNQTFLLCPEKIHRFHPKNTQRGREDLHGQSIGGWVSTTSDLVYRRCVLGYFFPICQVGPAPGFFMKSYIFLYNPYKWLENQWVGVTGVK